MRLPKQLTWQMTIASVLAASPVVTAQQSEIDEGMGRDTNAEAQAGGWRFSLYGGAEYQFDTESDGNDEFDVARFDIGFSAATNLSEDWKMRAGLSYSRDIYGFDEPNDLAAMEPWEDIDTIGLSAIFTYEMDRDWRLYTGPVLQFSAEDGADLTDGFTGGGIIGVAHDLTDDVTLGLGVGVVTQIEDDVKVLPAIQLEWDISNNLRLSSSSAGGGRRGGLELIWDAEPWEFAVGGGYEFNRFRLDDDGPGPDGVGEDERFPVYARATYKQNNTSFNFYAGIVTDGELRLEDDDGRKIADTGYDVTEFVAFSMNFRF